jgi:hypothetical protein
MYKESEQELESALRMSRAIRKSPIRTTVRLRAAAEKLPYSLE